MNNLKKVGLSALAGSLAMVSAEAGDFTVTGGAEMTYLSKGGQGASTGNPFGMSHNIDLTGSGEVNGIGWTVYTGTTGQTMAADSSSLVFDLGDAGEIGFDQGVGIYGIGTLDNNVPTAWEEADHNVTALGTGIDTTGDTGVLGYAGSFGGVGLSVEYNPSTANTVKAKAGAGTKGGTTGSNLNWALTYELAEGLSAALGSSSTDYTDAAARGDDEWTASLNYAMGMFKVGMQMTEVTSGTVGASSGSTLGYGAAANINDNLSVSFGRSEREVGKVSIVHVTEENQGINVAYTMGSAAIKTSVNTVDNKDGVAGRDAEAVEVSLSLSF